MRACGLLADGRSSRSVKLHTESHTIALHIKVIDEFWTVHSLSPQSRACGEATDHRRATLRMFGDAHNPTPTRSVTLPARSQARSDEPEASKQPLVVPEIHPFTGTFAASEHTVAFGSKAFRSAFPLHVVALVCIFGNEMAIYVTSVTPRLTWPVIPSLVFPLLTLGARIAVHRLRCESSAQRLGAAAWTLLVAGESAVDIISSVVHPNDFCEVATVSYL